MAVRTRSMATYILDEICSATAAYTIAAFDERCEASDFVVIIIHGIQTIRQRLRAWSEAPS